MVCSKLNEESRKMIKRRFAIERMEVVDELMRDEDGRTLAEAYGEALEIRLGRIAIRIALYTRIH